MILFYFHNCYAVFHCTVDVVSALCVCVLLLFCFPPFVIHSRSRSLDFALFPSVLMCVSSSVICYWIWMAIFMAEMLLKRDILRFAVFRIILTIHMLSIYIYLFLCVWCGVVCNTLCMGIVFCHSVCQHCQYCGNISIDMLGVLCVDSRAPTKIAYMQMKST